MHVNNFSRKNKKRTFSRTFTKNDFSNLDFNSSTKSNNDINAHCEENPNYCKSTPGKTWKRQKLFFMNFLRLRWCQNRIFVRKNRIEILEICITLQLRVIRRRDVLLSKLDGLMRQCLNNILNWVLPAALSLSL
jgi:hypothetical protein